MRIAVVDIGGTNIKSGIWENDRILEQKEQATMAEWGGAHVMRLVTDTLRQYRTFDAIGVSTAGQVDSEAGIILYANENIPGYTGMRIKEILEKEFCVPVAVQNDVNSAAIGEAYYGVGIESNDFLCLTYGTGVGGAIVMNGKIYSGSGYSAGEFGAIITHPKDRNVREDMFSGCYERYASTSALVNLVKKEYPSMVNGRIIFENIRKDEIRLLVNRWLDEVVYGLATLIHIFNPSLIVLGGGVMEQPYVIEQLNGRLYENIMGSFRSVKIVPAKLGNTAGLLGASQEALEEYHKRNKDL